MKCPRCQQENATAQEFCGHCGSPVGGMVGSGSYTDLQAEIERLRRSLGEASEQQTATTEILRAISASPTDLQGVLDTLAASAARLCDSVDAQIFRIDGSVLCIAAFYGDLPKTTAADARPIDRATVNGRAVVDRQTIHVHDLAAASDTEFPLAKAYQKRFGHRTIVATPLLREGSPIGAITIRRMEVRPFSDREIKILESFANQAVIAIENVRLFNETKEALEQQTATSEILKVISSSPTDIRPVFNTIAERAVRLCDAAFGAVFRFDDGWMNIAALTGLRPDELEAALRYFPRQVTPGGPGLSHVALTGEVVHIPDVQADPGWRASTAGPAFSGAEGYRTFLAVPLIREGQCLGAINVWRREPSPFSDTHIELLKTFADQAVIAIENVRLFNETKEALEQQTATSEILRVISTSPTDVQPVFDAIVRNAANVCGAFDAVLALAEGDEFATPAHHGPIPRPIGKVSMQGTVTGQAIREARTVHVEDLLAADDYPIGKELAREIGYRTVLCVPLLRDSVAIGAIGIRRTEARPFTDKQIALLQTFADQAVIAIENVRLFNETKEALEQQTATSEILRVISSSPTDIQPVLDAVAASAARVCGATDAVILRVEGQETRRVAHSGAIPLILPEMRRITPASPGGRAILECRSIHVHDAFDADFAHDYPETAAVVRDAGWRTILVVPLIRKGVAIGIISIRRTDVRPFTEQQVALLETFADQAVIAIENVRLFKELEEKNRSLTEALEQQTATSEILSVISGSPTDTQPVFEAIAESVVRLCDGLLSTVFRFDGTLLHFVAHHGVGPVGLESLQRVYPMPPNRSAAAARAVLDCRPIHIPDVLEDSDVRLQELAGAVSWRSCLSVPMLREGKAIGAIAVARTHAGPFSDSQIELLKTFADQAVIAIENVRLFTELQASNRELTMALDQQTATSDILKVISSSPTDVQPVFDAIVRAAVRLCHAVQSNVQLFDGQLMHFVAAHNIGPAAMEIIQRVYPMPPNRNQTGSRAILDKAVVHVPDVLEDPEYLRELAVQGGWRSVLSIPMVDKGRPIGALTVTRMEPGLFSDTEIALLQTFADQAVIAIENVRLFTELQEKNRALTEAHAQVTEALEQQTATSEILRVISSSPTDLQPVFDMVVRNAGTLCGAAFGGLHRLDSGRITLDAHYGVPEDELMILQRDVFPLAISRESATGRAILDREVVHIRDIREDPGFRTPRLRTMQNYRTILAVPMMREGVPLGALALWRREVQPFSETEIGLVRTFADQAVIAIENVRLFTELEARTKELTRSVSELTALGEVGRTLSSTLDLETVLQTIVAHANQLAGTDGGSIYEYDEPAEVFRLRASSYADPREAESLDAVGRAAPIPTGQGVVSRAAALRQPVQIPDITIEGSYESPIRGPLLQAGYRAILTVPLLLEERVIGALGVARKTAGDFAPEIVQLLTTFATQSAMAIQNARLFREIEQKSRELEAASRHKSEFLANMSHELRTPLNAVIGFSEVLNERMFGELNEKQDEYLKDIHASGQHLLSLINDILDLSKIEAGKMELELSDFDLPMTIDNALMLVRERAGRRGIELHRSVDERLGQIQADERKIRQVLLNLLSNAIKFTPEDGRIEVGAKPVNGTIEVSVTDTGVGIAPEHQDAIFEEFKQVGTSDKKVEGTGLGLALSRKFIELHGGKIWVKSQIGGGSTFTFTVPVRRGE